MARLDDFMRSRPGLTFFILLLTLGLGITIGSIVSDGVFSAQTERQVAKLELRGEGTPSVLDEEISLRDGFSKVAEIIEPAVVNISTQSIVERGRAPQAPDALRDFFGDDFWDRFFGPDEGPSRQKRTSLGSGVIVDSEGYLLTNYHVVAPIQTSAGLRQVADKIEVQLYNGEEYVAQVIGVDPESDLAVLKISADKPLPFAQVGDSNQLKVGDWVLAVGSPFSLTQTVTAGIVSATKRVIRTGIFGDYIQTDAAINPGNSGGPLVNMRGEVVGINSFITTTTGSFAGVGFAVPSSVFVNSYNQLVTTGKIERGWLGVSMNDTPMTPEMAEFFGVAGNDPEGIKDGDGVIITQLIDESGEPGDSGPAAKAGLQPEDVIVQFNNREIEDLWDLRAAVANTAPGETVPIVVVRKGQVLRFDVNLAERTLEQQQREASRGFSLDQRPEEETRPKEIGLEVKTLTAREADQMGLENERGVLILNVTPGSLGDDAGLEARQVITHINGHPVETVEQLKTQLDSIAAGQGVVVRYLAVERGSKSIRYTSFRKP